MKSIIEVLNELNKSNHQKITEEEFRIAEKEINEKMKIVAMESSIALGRAISSARNAVIS
jgi:hypothetical protein